MQEVLTSLTALGAYLTQAQQARKQHLSFRVEMPLTLPQLHQALDMLLPMVQRHTRHIRRDRSGYAVNVTLGYRTGVHLLDAWQHGGLSGLTKDERTSLSNAERIVAHAAPAGPADRLPLRLASALARRIDYCSPPHGRPGYADIVDAVAALHHGRANCQGISDGMYLLGSMAGLCMGYQWGWNLHGPHLWNVVRMPTGWYALDVTAALQQPESVVLMDKAACRAQHLRWEGWAEWPQIATSTPLPEKLQKAPTQVRRNMVY
ncbi:MAG: hypothetical protein ACI4MJ_04060 [Aristaeellaceae bacterium]